MQVRFEAWVEGLAGDWNISRQRYFGVPFPLWYRLDADGVPVDAEPLVPGEDRLPIDPSTDVPDGFEASQRNQPGGFSADPDVMDTWATSSLTPQIAGRWEEDPDLFARVFPMDLRPQAHEIIRTWLFATVVRSEIEHGTLPWRHAAISGWVVDPDHKKIGKSIGNAITPTGFLERHGTDAVRYWAASARLGADTVVNEDQMRVGRRLSIKLLNAAKFVLSRLDGTEDDSEGPGQAPLPLDASLLDRLAEVVEEVTASFERYDYARGLEVTEQFFWSFCDDYLELVKSRAYGDPGTAGPASARRSLALSLSVLLRLFAPALPYSCEEAWSWFHDDSVHLAPWPEAAGLRLAAGPDADPELLGATVEVLVAVRREKSAAKASMRAPVERCVVSGPARLVDMVDLAAGDLADAGAIARLELAADPSAEVLSVAVELATAETEQL